MTHGSTIGIDGRRIVVATHNRGKLREFRSLLSPAGWQALGLDEVGITASQEETGSTFGENARIKALACSLATGLPVLADDSGLEVFSLCGQPGLHSARYAGEGASDGDRIAKLLAELEAAGGGRAARFYCALALARRGTLLLETDGECRGTIADEPRGKNGFGFDPVFLILEKGRTLAELPEAEKNTLSHRAHAVRALLRHIGSPTA